MRKISVLIGVMLAAFAGFGAVQASAQSGYYPIEEMGIFAEGDLEVDIDLSGAMLRVAAGAMENSGRAVSPSSSRTSNGFGYRLERRAVWMPRR